jgi:phosphoribosyl-AMP cyclohydrolase
MSRFFRVNYSAGMCGTDTSEVVEANSEEEAVESMLDTAWDWFWSFQQEEDWEGLEPELDIWAEEVFGEDE